MTLDFQPQALAVVVEAEFDAAARMVVTNSSHYAGREARRARGRVSILGGMRLLMELGVSEVDVLRRTFCQLRADLRNAIAARDLGLFYDLWEIVTLVGVIVCRTKIQESVRDELVRTCCTLQGMTPLPRALAA